jgi:DNA-binding NarL/FixJ family response regulator
MKPSKQAKVIVATDRKGVPAAVRAMLTLEFDLVRVVYDADTLLREAVRLRPDLVVIEAELSLRDEFRATREIMRRLPDTKIIHHATDADAADDAETANVAEDDETGDAAPCEPLAQAVRLAASRCPSLVPAQLASPAPEGSAPELTTREREVLALLATGHAMKVIAYRLGITYRTVAFHKYKMMQRLGIRTNAGLTTYALRSGAVAASYPAGVAAPGRHVASGQHATAA